MTDAPKVDYRTDPSRYRHWKLTFDGPIATLTMTVDEDGGLREGYKLKLNSYDLGVDIELHDAVQRIRFEHPEVKTVVMTSGKSRMFCSGANIYMLGLSTHAWKASTKPGLSPRSLFDDHSDTAIGSPLLCAKRRCCSKIGRAHV